MTVPTSLTFDPFPLLKEDPNTRFLEILEAVRSGDPKPYDDIEAGLEWLVRREAEIIAKAEAAGEGDDEEIKLHRVALRTLQGCYESFRESRNL